MAKSTTPAENAVVEATAVNGNGPREHQGNSIHLTLQGKGGVGKSLIASILAQYFADRSREICCIDTDPVNRTLFQYKALNVNRLELLRDGRLDPRVFDDLMGRLITEDAMFVVDNGASTFIPLWNYILRNKALDSLAREGKKVYVHTVITGGQSLLDTLHGFRSLAETTSQRNIVVWLNEYFGTIERDGKRFGEMTAFLESETKVFGSVRLIRQDPDTFGRDLEDVIACKLTLDEAIKDGPFSIMMKQRLQMMRREWFDQLDLLKFV
jgi:hypothetical protein